MWAKFFSLFTGGAFKSLENIDTEISKGFDRYYFKLWAYAYYKAVRWFGKKYFNYISV